VQFLAPIWLALAAAAAVPLLLHLLRRRPGVRVPFPAARYLARAEQEHSARARPRNWLLLALRVLALLCVALAAARPLVGAAAGVGGRAPAALAIVLDNSLSTTAVVGGRPVLDALREQTLAALARAGDRDRVWLVTADGRVTGGGADAVRAAVRATPALAAAGDLPAAVTRAATLAAGAGLGPGAVLVVSDGQATAWARPARGAAGGRGVRTAVVSPGTPAPADRAVLDAAAVPARWSPAGEVTGQLSAPGDWQAVLADSAGRTVASARGVADVAGARVRVTLRPDARGWLAGALVSAPDEWRGSDVRHLATLVADPPPPPPIPRRDRSRRQPSAPSRRPDACAPAPARQACAWPIRPAPAASRPCSSPRPTAPASAPPTRRWRGSASRGGSGRSWPRPRAPACAPTTRPAPRGPSR
jgi:hypothetical protein